MVFRLREDSHTLNPNLFWLWILAVQVEDLILVSYVDLLLGFVKVQR